MIKQDRIVTPPSSTSTSPYSSTFENGKEFKGGKCNGICHQCNKNLRTLELEQQYLNNNEKVLQQET